MIERKSTIACLVFGVMLSCVAGLKIVAAQPLPPELTAPVNDFANVIPNDDRQVLDQMIRSLQQASGDVVVVATIDSVAPYADIGEYAVKMFENHGRGIGQKGKDNGVLVVVALKERQVRVEVGYDLEQFVTDGFAGSISRDVMVPSFRSGEYGIGLRAGVGRIIQRIAQGRGTTLTNFPEVGIAARPVIPPWLPVLGFFVIFLLAASLNRASSARARRARRWGGGPWSGWNSGVGPFAGRGGFGDGFGGFGGSAGGGGFGGFGGGRSGGGGGGAGW